MAFIVPHSSPGLLLVLRIAAVVVFWTAAAGADSLIGSGTWQSDSGESIEGTWRANFTRVGDQVSGEFMIDGSPLFTGGTTTGSLSGDGVVFGVIAGGDAEATFTGELSGNTVTGRWELPAISDTGSWTGTLK